MNQNEDNFMKILRVINGLLDLGLAIGISSIIIVAIYKLIS